ncbi:MAG: UDP-N-acetylmuramate--L-alanine ligase [Candidatus Krumholzibacteria bacterium]|nr:UDP-N-acetylmuramate--L-alanine ligase [Candidatus Krumholzibacteria bacterium]
MLGKTRHIHFVGIGGVGMSGIGEILLNLGFTVSGSDLEKSPVTERLARRGARIRIGHAAGNIAGCDVVVVSSAIEAGNPEVVAAREKGIPVIPRASMLGELMRFRTGIAVAGAHGKTTTTSLVGAVLQEAGADPTIIVGGRVKSLKANVRLGEGELLVAEADESDGSFTHLTPVFAIITNIDAEHLDYYGTIDAIYDAFVEFSRCVPFYGAIICCIDDPKVRTVLSRIDRRIVTYGMSPDADIRGRLLETGPGGSLFSYTVRGKRRGKLHLCVPGYHNVLNALSVCALAEELDVSHRHLAAAFAAFGGVARRFEIKGERGGILFVDDYGHHPTEVRATLSAVAGLWKAKRVVVIFQPHRFSRTKLLAKEFGAAFKGADLVYVTDIYAAGEKPLRGVTSQVIIDGIRKTGVKAVPCGSALDIARELRPGDVVLTLGAGDVWKIGEDLLRRRRGGSATVV